MVGPSTTDCKIQLWSESFTGLWTHAGVPAMQCPASHPWANNTDYVPFGTSVPFGVEIAGLGPIGVSIQEVLSGSGGFASGTGTVMRALRTGPPAQPRTPCICTAPTTSTSATRRPAETGRPATGPREKQICGDDILNPGVGSSTDPSLASTCLDCSARRPPVPVDTMRWAAVVPALGVDHRPPRASTSARPMLRLVEAETQPRVNKGLPAPARRGRAASDQRAQARQPFACLDL
jgi:hypothetical protein